MEHGLTLLIALPFCSINVQRIIQLDHELYLLNVVDLKCLNFKHF